MNVIKLTNPLKLDGKEICEIILRRPKVRDRLVVERSNLSDAEKELQLVANLAELPIEAVEEIDLADYTKVQKVLSDFLSE